MASTPVSLLDRLKSAKPDAAEWRRLQDIYLPLIRSWLARVPALGDEFLDLSQEIFFVVIRELPKFERQREGSFRAWLRRVTVNRVRTWSKQRGRRPVAGAGDGIDAFLDQLEAPSGGLTQQWNEEHDRHVFQKLVEGLSEEFTPTTWSAFREFALGGRPASMVATELGISENAVLLAKSRVLKRLRAEAAGLLD
jgi:RNA polymerase sigma-70 factor (ECF subfamily)